MRQEIVFIVKDELTFLRAVPGIIGKGVFRFAYILF